MSIIQKSANKKFTHSRKVVGIHPIIQFFIEKLNIHQMLNTYFPQDTRLALSFEKAIGVLVHNILGASSPMYEIADWCQLFDEECLGLEKSENKHICDDRIGRSLDQFYQGRHKDFFFQLALRSIKIFKLKPFSVHQDTTTITLSGKYDSWRAMELATYGHSKDHRPDLKQLVLGLTVSGDGAVPLCHRVYSGNQTDDTLHIQNFKRVQKLLDNSDFIYVADSKLATASNLQNLEAFGGKFISIMPRTWGEDNEFRGDVKSEKISWQGLIKKKDENQKEESYYLASGEHKAKGFTLLWFKSSSKKILDAQSRTDRLQRTCDELGSLSLKLNKRDLRERSKIEAKIQKILGHNNCTEFIEYHIESTRDYQKNYRAPGRPSAQSKSQLEWNNIFTINFKVDEEKVKTDELCDGVFPLITNVKDKSPNEILELYKYQPFLEKRHSQLKTWQRITPVLLKKDTRVVAYIHMHVVALTISTLIERAIRQAMKREKILSLPLYPEGHKCKSPTFFDLERLFRNVEKYEVNRGSEVILFPAELSTLQKQVLKLLDVPLSSYQ